jgi:hypothetical protein
MGLPIGINIREMMKDRSEKKDTRTLCAPCRAVFLQPVFLFQILFASGVELLWGYFLKWGKHLPLHQTDAYGVY